MNRATLETLFNEHHSRLLAEARSMLYDAEEARDVVSELFAELLQRQPCVEPGHELAYLSMSVRNRCRNVLARKTLTEKVTHLYALEQDTLTEEAETDRLNRLQTFMRSGLTEAQQRVFRLRFGQEKKYREIAAELGISEVAVYKHLVAALTRIKKHFNA
ncbi:MAG: sigma-70 family RNA polymerase sigma factor [Bacteroidaceae bacterium]|nr:sigma-70 family RNA polymerase sigma factor [Bacteroidaceae bacterium]